MRLSDLQNARGRIALDLIVACATVAVFGTLSCALYLPLQRDSQLQNVVVPAITLGESRSLLLSNRTCVGEITTKLTADDSPSLNTVVTIRSRFNGEDAVTTARFSAHFNPLLQLGRGTAAIESQHFSATLSATDVTPIRITATGRIGSSNRSFQLTIPGPVTLARNYDDSHRIEYAHLPSSLSGSATRSLLTSLADDLAIVVTPIPKDVAGCAETPSGSLDLTPLVDRFGPFVRPLLEGAAS